MKIGLNKKIIFISCLLVTSFSVNAESLFRMGVSQTVYPMQPRSLFNTVKAKTIGDVVTVLINEKTTVSNDVKLSVANGSEAEDNFTDIINKVINHKTLIDVDGFGGSTKTSNSASLQRTAVLTDIITTQVVQILPNGNLVIQGKKISINAGEKTQVILSGIVDPRLINNAGQIESNLIANLQLAVVGKGTISGSDSESLLHRLMNNLF